MIALEIHANELYSGSSCLNCVCYIEPFPYPSGRAIDGHLARQVPAGPTLTTAISRVGELA